MRSGCIAKGLTLITLLFFGENAALAKHGTPHSDTLESIVELCHLYEITNNPLPLFCLNCGNGDLEPSEQCDDGNKSDYDGCNSECSLELPPSNTPFLFFELNA